MKSLHFELQWTSWTNFEYLIEGHIRVIAKTHNRNHSRLFVQMNGVTGIIKENSIWVISSVCRILIRECKTFYRLDFATRFFNWFRYSPARHSQYIGSTWTHKCIECWLILFANGQAENSTGNVALYYAEVIFQKYIFIRKQNWWCLNINECPCSVDCVYKRSQNLKRWLHRHLRM